MEERTQGIKDYLADKRVRMHFVPQNDMAYDIPVRHTEL